MKSQKFWQRVFSIFLITGLILGMAAPTSSIAANPSPPKLEQNVPEVEPALLEELQARGSAGYLIYFSEKADLSPALEMDWEARGWFVMETLQSAAEQAQRQVRAYLDREQVSYKAFWIDNVIVVEESDLRTFNGLFAFDEIEVIRAETANFLIEPVEASNKAELAGGEEEISNTLAAEPNLNQVKAPDVWALGYRGQGSVIANIDSGVRYTHQALVNQYRGNLGSGIFNHNYNWLDPDGGTVVPTDTNGHGTHVMGTMVGYDGGVNEIGVAPEAEWIACRGCLTSSCPQTALLACAQWVTAPYPIGNPGSADPSKRPFAVNNSWGNCQQTYDNWYQGSVDAWHAAGILPIFANGNASNCGYPSPPGLNTVGNPARYGNVTGVGSSGTSNGQYANHSNWGPTDNPDTVNPQPGWADLKPQVLAPGVSIRSSLNSSDTAYGSSGWTGTSMSAPHVTGMIALMWQAAPCLIGNYAMTETIIEQTATPILYNDIGTGPRWPNYAAGWGEIDVLAAVQEATGICGPSGTLSGVVTDAANSVPLASAQILVTDNDTVTRMAVTDDDGVYTVSWLPIGTYEVSAQRFGYLGQTETGVEIEEDETTIQNFALTIAPSYEVSGTVTDVNTGWPLYARISIDGVPGSPFWNDPVTGEYSLVLPAGAAYDFTVSAFVNGYLAEEREVGPFNYHITENFVLDVDSSACNAPGYGLGYLYYEDFQANNGGYTQTQTGTNPAPWQWGEPVTWPAECLAGTKCWGTNLNGNYSHSAGEILTSPLIDLSGVAPGEQLTARWYQANHIESFTWDKAYAEVSIDGGPWMIMWQNPGTTVIEGWRELTYDISAAAGTNAQFRWRFTSDSSVNFPGWYIDRVAITGEGGCTPSAGGLVVGNVYDANTGAEMPGALVINEDGYTAVAMTTEDPNVDDAFFTIFSPPGEKVFTATFEGFGPDEQVVNVVDGSTVEQDFALTSGYLVPIPPSIEADVPMGTTTVVPLTLANEGTYEASFALSTLLQEEHFEDVFPPDGWSVINNGGTCVWQRNDQHNRPNYAGGDGFSASADSDRCGSGTTMDTELLTPVIDLSGATAASLDFIASYNHLSTSSFRVKISTDNGSSWTTLLTWTASQNPNGPGLPVSLDLTPFVGSSQTLISFHYAAPGWHWWAQVDQVVINSDVGAWISFDPATGVVAPDDNEIVNVTLDATGVPEPGQYTGIILLEHDTPYPPINIPVTMTVTSPPGLAKLEGVVQSQGYCNDNPAPLDGAEVVITSGANTWTRYTNAEGYYYIYLDESYSPVDLTVSAPEHLGDSAEDVVLVGQQTIVQNFDLILNAPCIEVDPLSIEDALTMGQTSLHELTITNHGPADLEFEIQKRDGGFTPPGMNAGSETPSGAEATAAGNPELADSGIPTGEPVYGPASGGAAPEDIGDAWETMAPLPTGRVFNAVIADENGFVYSIGGTSDGGGATKTTTVYRYNTADNTWTTMAPLPTAVMSIDGIVINNKIYIPGDNATANTFVYDIASDTWTTIPASGGYTARSQYQVVAIDTDLYVIGGIIDALSASTTEVWKLDTLTGIWSASVPMLKSRTSFSAAAIDGVIYVAGGVLFPGFTPDMTAEKFDGTSWSYIAPVPSGGGAYTRWSYNADGHGEGGLWLAGGRRDANWNVLDHAGYYDPETDTWTDSPTIPVMSQGRVYVEGDVATDGYFYVIGGRDGAGSIAYAHNERLYVGYPSMGDAFWLSYEPESGTVPGNGGSMTVEVTLDTVEITEPGTYMATLRIVSNDPGGVFQVPVELFVSATEEYGFLEGIVTGLGACDVNPGPIAGAEVNVEGSSGETWTLTTNAQGRYAMFVHEDESPLIVSVVAADHDFGIEYDVEIVGLETTVVDFELRWLKPCLSVEPEAFTVEVALGEELTLPLSIINEGAGTSWFSILEFPVGQILVNRDNSLSEDARASGSVIGKSAPVYKPSNRAVLIEESFVSGQIPPPGWTRESTNQNYTWKLHTYNPHTGLYAADVEYDPALVPQSEWLLSPEILISEGTLSFWSFGSLHWCRDTFDNCDLNVWLIVGELGGGDDIFVGTADSDWPDNWVWGQSVFNLTPLLPGGPVRIGFQYEGVDGAQIGLDTIVLEGEEGTLDVPWLSVEPDEGSVGADSDFTAMVTFTTLEDMEVGETFEAILRLVSDDPLNPTIDIPVYMTVVEGVMGVWVSPDMEGSQWPGETYTYPVEVMNMGNMVDTFLLTLSGGEWDAELDVDSVTLMPGESTMVYVTVSVPEDAGPADWDMVVFRATSTMDPDVFADCHITTISLATLPEHPELQIELTVEPSPILLGQPATFTALVSNIGDAAAHGVVASGEMPAHVTFVEASAACDFTDNVLTCDLGTIEPGESASAWVTVIFTATGPFTIGMDVGIPEYDPVSGTIDVLVETRLFLPLINRQ
jgi:uncharacterized repeat protein (TIGR01451 family)